MSDKPYLNLGCGKIILPAERPGHHRAVDEAIYAYPNWVNVDRNQTGGVDKCFNLFRYPWPLDSDSYDGALLAHICEHIPHEIRTYRDDFALHGFDMTGGRAAFWLTRAHELSNLQDGWYAFWSELWRVLTPGAIAHVIVPNAWSDGGMADPTHCRYILPQTFDYLCSFDASTFIYEAGSRWQIAEPPLFRLTELVNDLVDRPPEAKHALMTRLNTAYDFYIQMQAVKA